MLTMKEHQIEITVHHTFTPSPTYTYRYRSELINAENADVWGEHLGQTIKTLISEEAMSSELFQKIEEGVRKYKEWEAGREEREPSSGGCFHEIAGNDASYSVCWYSGGCCLRKRLMGENAKKIDSLGISKINLLLCE